MLGLHRIWVLKMHSWMFIKKSWCHNISEFLNKILNMLSFDSGCNTAYASSVTSWSEEYSWQFKAKKKSPSLCQEELHRKMLLSMDTGAERSHLSWKEIDHISTMKCLGHSDLEVCFISHQGSLQSQLHTTTLSIWFSFCIFTLFL